MTSSVVEDRTVRERACLSCITTLVEDHGGIVGALVSSVDGFPVAAHLRQPDAAPRLAAMTSSLVALAEAITREAHAGECRDLVIDGAAGRVLLMDVPQPDGKLLLTVLCAPTATLGQVLWAAQHCRRDIGARLASAT